MALFSRPAAAISTILALTTSRYGDVYRLLLASEFPPLGGREFDDEWRSSRHLFLPLVDKEQGNLFHHRTL